MRLVQASLAAVGAFWSELISTPSHAPSLWDCEALAVREAEIDAWEPDGLLGREPSHADYDDEPLGPCECVCGSCTRGDHCDTASCATIGDDEDFSVTLTPNIPDDSVFRSGGQTFACGCTSSTLPAAVTVPDVTADPAEVSAGVETTAPSAGLPFTFNAGDLVSTARELIYNHYRHNGVFLDGEAFLAAGAAELVVSQLVADLTAAYTEAQK